MVALLTSHALLLAVFIVESAAKNFSCWTLLQSVEPSLFVLAVTVLFFTHKHNPPSSIPQELLVEVSDFKQLQEDAVSHRGSGRRNRGSGQLRGIQGPEKVLSCVKAAGDENDA